MSLWQVDDRINNIVFHCYQLNSGGFSGELIKIKVKILLELGNEAENSTETGFS